MALSAIFYTPIRRIIKLQKKLKSNNVDFFKSSKILSNIFCTYKNKPGPKVKQNEGMQLRKIENNNKTESEYIIFSSHHYHTISSFNQAQHFLPTCNNTFYL